MSKVRRNLPRLLALLLVVFAVTTLFFDDAVRAADKINVPGDFATIQAAVDAAGNGDTIVVKGGPYAEAVDIDGKDNLTIQGKKVVIDGTGKVFGFRVQDSSGITISGFTIENADTGILGSLTTDMLIEKCTIRDTGLNGMRFATCDGVFVTKCSVLNAGWYGIADNQSTGLMIVKNVIDDSAQDGVSLTPVAGGDGSADAVVSKNTITDAGDFGIVMGGQRIRVEKNRISGATNGGIVISNSTGTDNCVIDKNTITGGGGNGIGISGEGHTVSKNKITAPGGTGIDVQDGNHVLTGNKITNPDAYGFWIGGSSNTFVKNKVSGAGKEGFRVTGQNNVLTKNSAKKSADYDLHDSSGTALNTYTGNKFKKVLIDP